MKSYKKISILFVFLMLAASQVLAGTMLLGIPKFTELDSSGDQLSGGLLYTYEPGTTTLKTSYSDYDISTPHTNPIVLDSRGQATIYLNGGYKLVLYADADGDSVPDGAAIWSEDNVNVSPTSGEIDASGYASLNLAHAAALTAGASIIRVTGDISLTASLVWDASIALIIDHGAQIDGAYTLNLASATFTGSPGCFGSSILVTGLSEAEPEFWGTDATAMQKAVNSGGQLTGQDTFGPGLTIKLSAKQYSWATQISIYSHIHIKGAGVGATEIDFSGTDYCFKNVNNANHFSYEGFTIDGNDNTDSSGGIYVGNGSADSGYTSGVAIRDVDIRDINKSGAIGLYYENPSHVSADNVIVDNIPNGTAHKVAATMANTGLFVYNECKFGDRVSTGVGMEVEAGTSASASVDGITANSCFFGGTTRAIHLKAPTGSSGDHRSFAYNGCHTEVANAAAGAIAVYIESGIGIAINTIDIHNNNPSGTNTEIALAIKNSGDVKNILINGLQALNLPDDGYAVYIDDSGSGDIADLQLIGDPLLINCDADSTRVYDPAGYLIHSNTPRENRINNGNFFGWTIGASSAPDFFTLFGDGTPAVAQNADEKYATYSADISLSAGTYAYLEQQDIDYISLQGQYVTFGCWVKTTAGDDNRVQIVDSAGFTSVSAPDDGNWHWVVVRRKIDSSATYVKYRLWTDSATGGLFDGACVVTGSGLNEYTPNWTDSRVLQYIATYDFPDLADNDSDNTDFTVNGAVLGDFVEFSITLDTLHLSRSEDVTAANTVTITRINRSGGAVNWSSATVRIRVYKRLNVL